VPPQLRHLRARARGHGPRDRRRSPHPWDITPPWEGPNPRIYNEICRKRPFSSHRVEPILLVTHDRSPAHIILQKGGILQQGRTERPDRAPFSVAGSREHFYRAHGGCVVKCALKCVTARGKSFQTADANVAGRTVARAGTDAGLHDVPLPLEGQPAREQRHR